MDGLCKRRQAHGIRIAPTIPQVREIFRGMVGCHDIGRAEGTIAGFDMLYYSFDRAYSRRNSRKIAGITEPSHVPSSLWIQRWGSVRWLQLQLRWELQTLFQFNASSWSSRLGLRSEREGTNQYQNFQPNEGFRYLSRPKWGADFACETLWWLPNEGPQTVFSKSSWEALGMWALQTFVPSSICKTMPYLQDILVLLWGVHGRGWSRALPSRSRMWKQGHLSLVDLEVHEHLSRNIWRRMEVS